MPEVKRGDGTDPSARRRGTAVLHKCLRRKQMERREPRFHETVAFRNAGKQSGLLNRAEAGDKSTHRRQANIAERKSYRKCGDLIETSSRH